MIDALRGLAALLVVIGHARMLLLPGYGFQEATAFDATLQLLVGSHGHAAVLVFFVISGFLVGGAAFRQADRPEGADWTGFLLRRILRLQVVLLPALLLTAGLDVTSAWVLDGRPARHEAMTPIPCSPSDFLGNAFLLQGILVRPFGSNAPLWTISWEWACYLTFPALLVAVRRGNPWPRALAAISAFCIIMIMGPRWIMYFMVWCSGAAVARFRIQTRPAPLSLSSSLLLLACSIALARLLAKADLFPVEALLIAVSASFVIWAAPTAAVAGGAPFWTKIGSVSYSLYAIHTPLIVLLSAFDFSGSLMPDWIGWGAVILVSASCVPCAWVFWWCFEQRTPALRKAVLGGRLDS